MKISEYAAITNLETSNIFVVDGPNGTKKIDCSALPFALMSVANVLNNRNIFRGKNLGSEVSEAHKAAISNGTFVDLYIGDYWTINGVNWRIADIDYWYNIGDVPLTNHHLLVIPESSLYNTKMNSSAITTGGYVGSEMYTSGLTEAKSTISSAFGSNVLSHREYLINAVSSGYPSAGAWSDSTVDLMNEPMVYGSYVNTPASNGTNTVKRYTSSQTQLAIFRLAPQFINCTASGTRIGYWLRDVVNATSFTRVSSYGPSQDTSATQEYGVRPVFAIG